MLTLEETGWSLNLFKVFSISNVIPIGVDVKSGKIERQWNPVEVFVWKSVFGLGISHWVYMFGRLVQSTILEPGKYFRWDHFVIHFPLTFLYAVLYFVGFRLFVQNAEENVMIFNQFFEQREDPVQNMVNVAQSTQVQRQMESESGNGNETGKTARGKSGNGLVSTSGQKLDGEGQTRSKEVTEDQSRFRSRSGIRPRPRPLLTWPPQYSLDELLAKLLALVLLLTGFLILLVLAVDPSRCQLLYSSLPPEWQNAWCFLPLLAVEALCLTVVFATAGFTLVTQVLFFSKCQLEFQRMILQLRSLQKKFQNGSFGNEDQDIKKEIWILRQILEAMRELVVLIELFNRCYPFCIFAWKIYCLSISIMCYFFVIRHFQDFPLLAVFVGYCATATTATYTIMYEHAFSIPRKMDVLKAEFLLTAQKTTSTSNANSTGNKTLWAEMRREIKRIHGVGVKVGSFNIMERESTPRFVDFVLRNVVSLLVTFPR